MAPDPPDRRPFGETVFRMCRSPVRRPTMARTEGRRHGIPRKRDIHAQVHIHGSTAMRLAPTEAKARLAEDDHGILCTLHAGRGIDAVPVVFVVDEDDFVGVPVDLVKPKSSGRLQRERNLEADPRATLLVEHWDREDWSQLWWVRAELRSEAEPPPGREAALAELLASRYRQYRDQPFARVLVLRIVGLTGWAARPDAGANPSSTHSA
jgi:PPOX class probable F420-dependent enzyme